MNVCNSLRLHFYKHDVTEPVTQKNLELLADIVSTNVSIVDFDTAEVIYFPSPSALEKSDLKKLNGKQIICEFIHTPFQCVMEASFQRMTKLVSLWVTRTVLAKDQALQLNLKTAYVPLYLGPQELYNWKGVSSERNAFRRKFGIPLDCYVIASFQDQARGENKLAESFESSEIFLQIVLSLLSKKYPVHILLAGINHSYLKSSLEALGIPYSYIDNGVGNYDDSQQISNKQIPNNFYTCVDLVLIVSDELVSSYAILRAVGARGKVLARRTGLAEELLDSKTIFDSLDQAVQIITEDVLSNSLQRFVDIHYERYLQNHSAERAQVALLTLFNKIRELPIYKHREAPKRISYVAQSSSFEKVKKLLKMRNLDSSVKVVSILREFYKPPYGGGNQFMLALKSEFEKIGIRVIINDVSNYVDAYLFDSLWLDLRLLDKLSRLSKPRVGHRIDGPIHLYRGKDKYLDKKIFEINHMFATVSIIQSIYTLRSLIATGYSPIAPIVIPNAVDPTLFYKKESQSTRTEKINLVSSSWSDNPMKGADDYKWIDSNLDFSKYSYSFFGRVQGDFKNIVINSPLASLDLANSLRKHHIYITASQNDPCSNALIEAMACGLPVLYRDSGGHPELAKFGGLPYRDPREIPAKLERIVKNYDLFSNCIDVTPLSVVAKRYLEALFPDEAF